MSTCIRTRIAELLVASYKIHDGYWLAYRVNEDGGPDPNAIGFGHGKTRDDAIIDLYKRTK